MDLYVLMMLTEVNIFEDKMYENFRKENIVFLLRDIIIGLLNKDIKLCYRIQITFGVFRVFYKMFLHNNTVFLFHHLLSLLFINPYSKQNYSIVSEQNFICYCISLQHCKNESSFHLLIFVWFVIQDEQCLHLILVI